jgi:hypothetical protein
VWLQASLPVSSGGLGVCSTVQLAPSAFLASAAGCLALTKELDPPSSPPAHGITGSRGRPNFVEILYL